MARLTSPQGAKVEVRDEQVDALRRMGFTAEEKPKATTKKSSSSKSKSD